MRKITLYFTGILCLIQLAISQQTTSGNILKLETNGILTAHLSYDRIFPVNEKSSLMLGADVIMGVGFAYGATGFAPEINVLLFGPKHFLEVGGLMIIDMEDDDPEEGAEISSPGLRTSYRYELPSGLSVGSSLLLLLDIDPPVVPTLYLGYSF
ncbi:MAG: hypothetical protein K9N35_12280 [Candidatus Marinimicrobia bacterium]|nr:hypothetical protein [Candidatus Neomarinimicrobiota bacterium]